MHARGELEMRIEGDGAAQLPACAAALRALDPEASLRVDPATGILHVRTRADALDVTDALGKAGITVRAMTG